MKKIHVAATALAFLLPVAHTVHAEDGTVLDYRDRRFRDARPDASAADKARIVAALASTPGDAVKALGKDFAVLGHARGQLTKGGEVDFYLASLSRPVASEPFPKTAAQVIVAMKGNDAVATYVLPADRQYTRLVGTVDVDGDRNSEVLLEASGYNMGQLIIALDAVKLGANGATGIAQSVPEVYADTCENPVGAKARASKTIGLRGGKLVTTTHQEKCA